ncbi:MAG: 3-deoxy-D-manno-octulosonic acid transferase [Candidatus Tectomicrobia bacterium]|nr:3-deoxy-D-manno-octulosonic acid transferase [Candidatus Tectomicrobia bacterium]
MDRLYSAVLWGCAAVALPYFAVRSATTSRYRAGWRQRPGFGLPGAPPRRRARCIWFHAVSVGEVRAVLPLLRAARARYAEARLVLSTVTEAGQQVAAREATDLDALIYFPFDFVRCIRRHLAALRPQLVVLTETELWPNFLRVCRAEGVPVMLANGRLSPRSFARYRRCGWFVRRMVRRLSACAMQSPEDLARIVALGAPAERCRMAGNMKFEASADAAPARRQALRAAWGLAEATPLLLAGSTHPGEEEQLLEAFARVRRAHPAACLLLAPRHVERAAEVAELARARGFAVRRRGELGEAPVLLLETMGELKELYAMADLAYIGGSLVPHGGQNPLEAAACGVGILCGPHTFNFAAICERLRRGEAAWRVADAAELAAAWTLLLDDPPRRSAMGSRARQIIAENQGAVERHLEIIAALLEGPGGRAASA